MFLKIGIVVTASIDSFQRRLPAIEMRPRAALTTAA